MVTAHATMTRGSDRSLTAALEDYQRAKRDFITVVGSVPAAGWALPCAPGKWSPAQEVEHIALAHELFAAQLAGAPPMRVLVSGWKASVLRGVVLPWILRTGRFPRAKSPREARPSAEADTPDALIARIEAAAAAVATHLATGESVRTRRVDHPYFGSMTLYQALVLSTVHTRHHQVTLARAARSG